MTNTDKWEARAACNGDDPSYYHPEGRMSDKIQKEIVADVCIGLGCPVVAECLADADRWELRATDINGVRGAMTELERKERLHASRTRVDSGCGTPGGYSAHRRALTDPCDPCRAAEAKRMKAYRAEQKVGAA